ncbi:MAG: hypothetical protein JWQ88_2000, partial [Rhodoferax sp.]|nr:hypothetical protein [Rhodoferax sp.]
MSVSPLSSVSSLSSRSAEFRGQMA